MRQAIVTKYLGPTDHHGSRVKARCEAGSLTLGWDYAHGPEENHKRCAEALQLQLGWGNRYFIGGALPGTAEGFCFVDVGPARPAPSSTETDG
jgi:hypothetical protein